MWRWKGAQLQGTLDFGNPSMESTSLSPHSPNLRLWGSGEMDTHVKSCFCFTGLIGGGTGSTAVEHSPPRQPSLQEPGSDPAPLEVSPPDKYPQQPLAQALTLLLWRAEPAPERAETSGVPFNTDFAFTVAYISIRYIHIYTHSYK